MIYGYCRISTATQSIDRQVNNIRKAYPDAVIFQEAFTGTKVVGRKEFNKLLHRVHAGDTIVFDAVDRMSRNAAEGVEVYMSLYGQGINLVFLKNPTINTEYYRRAAAAAIPMTGTKVDVILEGVNVFLQQLARDQVTAAFDQAQAEVDHLHQRTREGMVAAGALNVVDRDGNIVERGSISEAKTGKIVTTKKSVRAKEIIRQHSKSFGGSLADDECMKLAGCSRNSFYKYKREVAAKLEDEVDD